VTKEISRGFLFLALSFSVFGASYPELREALGLTDSQIVRLQQKTAGQVLDETQQARLRVIASVLDRGEAGSEAIGLGVISPKQWLGSASCYYPVAVYAAEFDLIEDQVLQLEKLKQAAQDPFWQEVQQNNTRRMQLLNSGSRVDCPEVVQLDAETSQLWQDAANARPPRDLILAVLNDAQRTKITAFESDLQLASEAIELGLIPRPLKGEVLCH